MSHPIAPGPYKIFPGTPSVPLYVIPFDKAGSCTAPQTRASLIQDAQQGGYTDIYLFSHGWNNDWDTATARYEHFLGRYGTLRKDLQLEYGRSYKPLLVGVFWPSTALVMPSERAPEMAAEGAADAEWLAELPAEAEVRVRSLLAAQRRLAASELQELAALLAPLWNRLQRADRSADTDLPLDPVSPGELAALWAGGVGDDDDEAGGLVDSMSSSPPEAALSLGDVLGAPRDLLRTFTVLQMKDRGLHVGGSGAGALLRDLLLVSSAHAHLIGHSYGCLVVLSALAAAAAAGARKVESVLLLQAAVSRYCFAAQVPDKARAGGYRVVFDHVVQPILATHSRRDLPLRHLFHLAVRRDRDLGQPAIAGQLPAPSKYAALGGYGPAGCLDGECSERPIHSLAVPYTLAGTPLRLISLEADETILGHGDISVAETWWALFEQVRQS